MKGIRISNIPTYEEAVDCAKRVVASRHICAGCPGDYMCKVSTRFTLMRVRERIPLEKDLVEKSNLIRREKRLMERLEE